MHKHELAAELEAELTKVPLLDVHTHLVGGKLSARGLHDVLLYHMIISDLYAAGCPSGARLTEYPNWPSREEAHARLAEAIPYLPLIRNTSGYMGVQIILRDLYEWRSPLTPDNWQKLDSQIRERADDRSWQHAILDRTNVQRTGTEIARRESGEDDERLQYALEWAFFTRCQWGEYDTALYELERCWEQPIASPSPIGTGKRPSTEHVIRSVEDVRSAMKYYVDTIPYDMVLSTATGISTDIDYRLVSDEEMAHALKNRDRAGAEERDTYASYIHELFLSELEQHSDRIVLQFSLGAEPLPFEAASRVSQRTIGQIADMISRHPRLRFQCFLGSRHANQALCTLARELPNFSLAGYWWHNFFPDIIRQIISERLDMLPVNKQIGFFSDAYCVEWTYAKAVIVRRQLADVLADRILQRQYSREDALSIARDILFESPRALLAMQPRSIA